MKTLFLLLISLVLSIAHANGNKDASPVDLKQTKVNSKPDLDDGDVVREAWCSQGKKKLLCVAVKKDDKLYVVVLDEKGEVSITWISPKGNVLVWSRDSI